MSPAVPGGGVSPGTQEAAGCPWGLSEQRPLQLGNPNETEIVSDARLQQQL